MAPHGAVSSGAALCSTGRPSWRSQLGIVGGVPRASAPPDSRYEGAITLPPPSTKSGNFAGLYSLVGSCIANEVEPTEYLTDVLPRIRDASTDEQLDALLPDRWTPRDPPS
jgi:hypothetical protein